MLRYLLIVVSICVLGSLYDTPIAASSSSLVISHIQTGGAASGTSGQEFVAVHNNLSSNIDITDWCISYSDYTFTSADDLFCFEKLPEMDAILLPSNSTVLIVSPSLPLPDGTTPTGYYKNTSYVMSGTRGHVVLYDHDRNTVDKVAWVTTSSSPPASPENTAAQAPSGGKMIAREYYQGQYIDTDNNYDDFIVLPSAPPMTSQLIDYKVPAIEIDVCPNLNEYQYDLPVDYGYDSSGNCELLSNDICKNISNVQLYPPDDMSVFYDGNCYDSSLDVCTNIAGFQLTIPENYRLASNICKEITSAKSLMITEVLANSIGTDEGNEFIEIYNPNEEQIDLSEYKILIGKSAEKSITLPEFLLSEKSYISFSDAELGFSLLNTTTQLKLQFYDGTIVNEMIPYLDPPEQIAWALIDGVWQYTNNPTPSVLNMISSGVMEEGEENSNNLAECPEGKYRNPLTNRCRNIEQDVAVLAQCDADEYRSPDTNRCRKITSANVLAACQAGYERNPDTNRCRKIEVDDGLKPCEEGYERNPATNRCKKVLFTGAVKATSDNLLDSRSQVGGIIPTNPYTIAATAGVGALGYGVYEWRTELGLLVRRLLGVFSKK